MKKNILIFLTAAVMFMPAVSCQKEEESEKTPAKTQGPPILTSFTKGVSATNAMFSFKWDKNGQVILKWGAYIAESEDAVMSQSATAFSGNDILFPDLKPSTKYYVRAYATNSKGTTYTDVQSFTTTASKDNEAVDMGLSVKWASVNLGGSSPEDFGFYYLWADPQGHSGNISDGVNFLWDSYDYFTDKQKNTLMDIKFTITKYCSDPIYGYQEYSDSLTTIVASDDAATVALGGTWRMPTEQQWTELRENCIWTYTSREGISGYEIKSNRNNAVIFLPLAGNRSDIRIITAGTFGDYWSSTLCTEVPTDAYAIEIGPSVVMCNPERRDHGYSIRPVCD